VTTATITIRISSAPLSLVSWSGIATLVADDTTGGGSPIYPVHNSFTGRDVADTHPLASITGLVDALDAKAPAFVSDGQRLFWATPSGANGPPSLRVIAAVDIPTLNQNTTGSAGTLTTPRTLTIGSTGKTFNGSTNVSWSLAEIGAQAAGTYLTPSNVSGTAGQVAVFSAAGTVASDPGFRRTQLSGKTTRLFIGDGTSAASIELFLNGAAGQDKKISLTDAGVGQFYFGLLASGHFGIYDATTAYGIFDTTPGNGEITIGNTFSTKPLNLASGTAFQINGTTAISTERAGDLTALKIGSLAGTLIGTAGNVSALSGTNLVLGNGSTIAQSMFQTAGTYLTPSNVSGVTDQLAVFSGANTVGGSVNLSFSAGQLYVNGSFNVTGNLYVGAGLLLSDPSKNITATAGTYTGLLWGAGLRSSGNVNIDTGYSLIIDSVTRIGSTGIGNLLKLQVSSTDVVGTRKTGWTAATGTATRTTFATSTVTLPQLAEHMKALLDDLIAHGLIGA